MTKTRINRIFILVLIITGTSLLMAGPGYGSKSVSATLNTHQFPEDMAAVLTITAEGGRSVDIKMPEVNNLRFHRRGQSSQVQMTNGSFSASISTVYLVEPLEPGKYSIPPISVHCDGKELFTKTLLFEVTPKTRQQNQTTGTNSTATGSRMGRENGSKLAFMRVHPGKQSLYPGEMVPVHIDLYISRKVQANQVSLPALTGDGFALSPLDGKPRKSLKIINNERYLMLSWSSYLTGIKEGTHTLSFELNAELLMPQRSRINSRFQNQGFFQDDFFNDFFQDYQTKTVKVTSPELKMENISLPDENRPDDFSGAVGQFNLTVTATPTKVIVGEPITLSMTIEGTGNFDRVNECTLPESDQWKQYTPSVEFEPDDAGRPNRGAKKFEQAVVPKDVDTKEIPAVTFSYFDPITGHYKRLISEPIPLTIQGDQQQPTPSHPGSTTQEIGKTGESTPPVQTGQDGLAPIKIELGSLQQSIKPLFRQLWFIFLIILCSCLLCGHFFIRLVQRRHANNPEHGRRIQMKRQLQLRLTEIRQARDKNDQKNFLDGCKLAIQEQLGMAWQVEGAAVTLADLEKKLEPDSKLIDIFSMADQAAYGGQTLSSEEMQQLHMQLESELGKLI